MSTGAAEVVEDDMEEASGTLDHAFISQAEPMRNVLELQTDDVDPQKTLLAEQHQELCQPKGIMDMHMHSSYPTSTDDPTWTSLNLLPEIILFKIFQLLDNKSLLNCRLVCKPMKSLIDNSSKIMRRLSFTVVEIDQFLDSTVAMKAKNICLRHGLQGSDEDLALFYEAVSGSVESIVIDFPQTTHHSPISPIALKASQLSEAITVHGLLTNCKTLDTLKISSSRGFFQYLNLNGAEKFVNLRNFVLNVQGITAEEITWLEPLLLSFSSLNSIEFYMPTKIDPLQRNIRVPLRQLILGCLNKYPKVLKVLNVSDAFKPRSAPTKILVAVVTGGGEIDFRRACFDLNDFLQKMQFAPSEKFAQGSRNFASLKRGWLKLGNERWHLTNAGRQMLKQCSNVECLQLSFENMAVMGGDLQFLQMFAKLQSLILVYHRDPTSPPLAADAFAFGLRNIRQLSLDGNLFSSPEVSFASFHLWFPSVTALTFTSLMDLPFDLMYFLCKMPTLKMLLFEKCTISDAILLRPCDCIIERSPLKKRVLPAIMALKRLRQLSLHSCPLLTDMCLVNGIQYCSALTYLSLKSSGDQINQFTNVGLSGIVDAGHLALQQDLTIENVRTISFIRS